MDIATAGYLLWMIQRMCFGPVSEFLAGLGHHLTDMRPVEILTLAPLGALTVVLGLYPALVLDLIVGPVKAILAAVDPAVAMSIGR
jgi:NADH-quinone oxidoreductase subunit M